MASPLSNSRGCRSINFNTVVSAFLNTTALPFAAILSGERIASVFAKHDALFGCRGIYSTATVLWSFLGQVLHDGKEASCQAAVARLVSFCKLAGKAPPTSDTGDYCKARAKLCEVALRELSCGIAREHEAAAGKGWLWKGLHAKLIDGSTFTMPDTPENQEEYPQQRQQALGVGLPVARIVAIISLGTACITDLAVGPYQGKESGEPALLRCMLSSMAANDVAVMDRYYCSFMMIALLLSRGTQVCARKHQRRHSDFRRGKRLGKYDHIITWSRPVRPAWMDEETYEQIPETLQLREIRYAVVEPGRRTKVVDIITTLTDAEEYTKQDIADLYGYRWNSELDIRSIKCSLNLGHVRCKSPEMVRRELWTTILAYNLVRSTAAGAAQLHDVRPRQISFVSSCQYILSSWMIVSCGAIREDQFEEFCRALLEQIASCEVAHRPGRLEPRVVKRRKQQHKLMNKPRHALRTELRKKYT